MLVRGNRIHGIHAGRRRTSVAFNGTALSGVFKSPSVTLSNGNLTASSTTATATKPAFTLDAKVTGKWYHEVTINTLGTIAILGVATPPSTCMSGDYPIIDTLGSYGIVCYSDGNWKKNTTGTGTGGSTGVTTFSFATGDIIGIETDLDNSQIRLRKNGGAWTGYISITAGHAYAPYVSPSGNTSVMTVNFGATPWANAPSAGFSGWSKNAARTAARYWRVWQHHGARDTFAISELALRETSGGTNGAAGATASASSNYDISTYPPSAAIDGNTATDWVGGFGSGQGFAYYQIDLGAGNEKKFITADVGTRATYTGDYPTILVFAYSYDGVAWFPLLCTDTLSWPSLPGTQTFYLDNSTGIFMGGANPAAASPISASKWRVFETANYGGSGNVAASEIEMRATVGGADQCSGGTAISQSDFSGSYSKDYAFNNDGGTLYWVSAGGLPATYIGYDFGSSKTVVEIAYMPRPGATHECPRDGRIEYWDGTAWQIGWDLAHWATWTDGAYKILRQPSTGSRWRVRITANSGSGVVGFTKVEMRAASGGPDQCVGGQVFGDSEYSSSYSREYAFDSSSSEWATGGLENPPWIAYDFLTQVEIVEVALTSRGGGDGLQTSSTFSFERWNAATRVWDVVWTASGGAFGGSQTKVFTRPVV